MKAVQTCSHRWALGTASRLNNRALLLQAQGELAAARPLFERALAISERVLGPDHSDADLMRSNLAALRA